MMISIVISSTYAMAQQMGSLIGQGVPLEVGGMGCGQRRGSWQDIRRRTRPAVAMAAGRRRIGDIPNLIIIFH